MPSAAARSNSAPTLMPGAREREVRGQPRTAPEALRDVARDTGEQARRARRGGAPATGSAPKPRWSRSSVSVTDDTVPSGPSTGS